ncbi:MAG: ATP-binding protein [bacterium]|nr:ATP-binding protein [bacterium]
MNIFGLSGLFIAITSFPLALLVFVHNRKEWLNRIWTLFSISVGIWGLGVYKIAQTQDINTAFWFWRFTHIGVILIPVFFAHFIYIFLDIKKKWPIYAYYVFGAFFLLMDATPYFISDMRYVFNSFYYDSPPSFFYTSFVIFYFFTVIYTHYLLYKNYSLVSDAKRDQIRYFFLATLVGFSGGSTSFLPVFGIDFYPVLNLTVPLYPIIMSYAIMRHRLFNIRVIAAELLVVGIIIALSVEIFFSVTLTEQVFRTLLLVLVTLFGYLLIRSTLQEVRSREEIEKLAKDLEEANEKLRKLDEAKSEFISLAGHQLRAPLTVIKGYTSMLMEGTFGEISKKVSEALNRVFISANNLTKLVSELLDLSRIESGRIKYEFKDIYLEDVVEKVLKELEEVSKAKRVAIEFKNENKKTFSVFGDADKLYEVVLNLLDNALKYSTASPIVVALKPRSKRLALSVADKGMGIPRDEMSKLFIKFGRTEIAKKERPDGMGLGLYFVKRIVDDHKGRIWAESGGLEKGSTFFVELPAK